MKVQRFYGLVKRLLSDDFGIAEIPITSSDFWQDENECTEEILKHVFRSTTSEEIPLLEERLKCLREAGQVLYEVSILMHLPHNLD